VPSLGLSASNIEINGGETLQSLPDSKDVITFWYKPGEWRTIKLDASGHLSIGLDLFARSESCEF